MLPIMKDAWEKTWPEYVRRHSRNAPLKDIGERITVHPGTIGRWLGTGDTSPTRPDGDQVVKFARAYGRPPVEALIAAGYLKTHDVADNEVIELGAALSDVSADELLAEVRRRIHDDVPRAPDGDVHHVSDYARSIGRPDSDHPLKQRNKRA
jgi:hypothetical protein